MNRDKDNLEEATQLNSRKQIYNLINSNPGLHFREIQRRTNIAVGSLQYHLDVLKKKHLIRIEKDGKFNRFYSIRGTQLGENERLMELLRKETTRRILIYLIEHPGATNQEIANNLNINNSSVSWQLDKLWQEGILEKEKEGKETKFFIIVRDKIKDLLINYRKTFLDEIVDRFVETWENI